MSVQQAGTSGAASNSASNTHAAATHVEPYLKIKELFPSSLNTAKEIRARLLEGWNGIADQPVTVAERGLYEVEGGYSHHDLINNAPELTGEFRGQVGVRVQLVAGSDVLPYNLEPVHVNMTLGVRGEGLTPDLVLCIDHLPTEWYSAGPCFKRYPHIFWKFPDMGNMLFPETLSVKFEMQGYMRCAVIRVTSRNSEINKSDLQSASTGFHEDVYMDEYNKILDVFRDFGESVSDEQDDFVTFTFLCRLSDDVQAAELDRFKSRCDHLLAAAKARAHEYLSSLVRAHDKLMLAEYAAEDALADGAA